MRIRWTSPRTTQFIHTLDSGADRHIPDDLGALVHEDRRVELGPLAAERAKHELRIITDGDRDRPERVGLDPSVGNRESAVGGQRRRRARPRSDRRDCRPPSRQVDGLATAAGIWMRAAHPINPAHDCLTNITLTLGPRGRTMARHGGRVPGRTGGLQRGGGATIRPGRHAAALSELRRRVPRRRGRHGRLRRPADRELDRRHHPPQLRPPARTRPPDRRRPRTPGGPQPDCPAGHGDRPDQDRSTRTRRRWPSATSTCAACPASKWSPPTTRPAAPSSSRTGSWPARRRSPPSAPPRCSS